MPPGTPHFTGVTVNGKGEVFAHGTTPNPKQVEAVAVTLVRQGGAILQGEVSSATQDSWRVPIDKPTKPLRDGEKVFCVGVLVQDTPIEPPKDGKDDPKVWKDWVAVEVRQK